MTETVCGDCGIPLSWPDVYGCGKDHGELTKDDKHLVNRSEIAEIYGLTRARVDQFVMGAHMATLSPFPDPAVWTPTRGGYISRWRMIDVLAWGFRHGYYSED